MLRKGEKLPDKDHVLRYIDKRYVSGNIIQGAGFFRRPHETASSVDWLEFYQKSHIENAQTIIQNCKLTLHKNDRFAELNIEKTHSIMSKMGFLVEFVYDPTKNNASHSLIRGLPERNSENTSENELFDDILRIAVTKTYNAL